MEQKLFIIRSLKLAFFFINIVALFFVTSLSATTMIELTLKDLCDQSSDIVMVKVISAQSYLVKKENRIFTKIELEIIDKIKGQFQKYDQNVHV